MFTYFGLQFNAVNSPLIAESWKIKYIERFSETECCAIAIDVVIINENNGFNDNNSKIPDQILSACCTFNRFVSSEHTLTVRAPYSQRIFAFCVWLSAMKSAQFMKWSNCFARKQKPNSLWNGIHQRSQQISASRMLWLHAADALHCKTKEQRSWGGEHKLSSRKAIVVRHQAFAEWVVCGELWAHNAYIVRIMVEK